MASARDGLRKDPLLAQLRRVSRNAGIDTSISDTAAEIRTKVLTNGPQKVTSALCVLANPDAPMASSAPRGSTSVQRLDWEGEGDVPLPLPELVEARPQTAAAPASESFLTQPVVPQRASSARAHVRRMPMRPTTEPGPVSTSARSAGVFLNEGTDHDLALDMNYPSHTRVLSRVIASTEHLEMEIARNVTSASSDWESGVEAARLEVLHSHLNALKTSQRQCLHLQRQAEARAGEIALELAATNRALTLQKQDTRRLRWMLTQSDMNAKKTDAVNMFSMEGDKAKVRQARLAELEKASFQAQLDEANAMADAMVERIKETRLEGEAKLLELKDRHEEDLTRTAAEIKKEMNAEIIRLNRALARERKKKRSAHVGDDSDDDDMDIPPGGSIGPGGVILDADGNPVLGKDGKPLVITDPRVPPGGRIGEGGIILDANGRPVLGADGKPMYATPMKRVRIPPGGSIGPGGIVLDANGKPVLGKDGKPLRVTDPRVPPGGSIGPGGVILDANGRPVLGADGKPMICDPRIPPGGSIRADGVILDAKGQPLLGADGKPMYALAGGTPASQRIPPGGSIGAGGIILDANGNPVLGADGKPLIATGLVPPGGSIGPGGVVLDANGNPVLGADGKPITVTDPRVPPGGSIGPGGVILDASGNPVLGADGKPMICDPRIPPGGSIGPGGVILDADGKPILGADGKPLLADPAAAAAAGHPISPYSADMIPPGGSIGAGGVVLDANGNPVLGADGKPLVILDSRVPPGGSVGPGGIILDAEGNPVLGADGKPIICDPRIPPGGSVGEGGVILDAFGNPVLGADGKPLYVEAETQQMLEAIAEEQANIDKYKDTWAPPSSSMEKGRNGSPKKKRKSEIVPAGRMVTFSSLRARDVPDVDLRGSATNISDPYLILAAIDDNGEMRDQTKTSHIENSRHPSWKETLRLFMPDQEAKTPKTKPFKVLITLMDRNAKKADVLIGDVQVALKVGSGKVKIEIPSRSPSSMRPFVYFRYEATPQMYFEEVEYVRVAAETNNEGDDGTEGQFFDGGKSPSPPPPSP